MIKVCQQNKSSVLDQIRAGKLDAAALSRTDLVDDIILSMLKHGILSCLGDAIPDKRASNNSIPFELILALAVAAKMKVKTALTDIPFAITDHRVLAELGYNIIDPDKGIMTEGSIRHLFERYNFQDYFAYYNNAVQNHTMPKMELVANIHILDCTKLEVNFDNKNYEGAAIATDSDGNTMRGYKLATLRGIVGDTGIIEDTRFGPANVHDLTLSEEMLKTSPVLKPGDILICDRGFLSIEMINYLKINRGVDTYIPLKKNMGAYHTAVLEVKNNNEWVNHPNKKRKNQKIALATQLETCWHNDYSNSGVGMNGCVIWDKSENEYFVFITTDLTKTAREIVLTYELRPEIEEDYRQIKDFWKIEDFKPTKISLISFHIICVLFGYLFFQLYTLLPEGEQYARKSLPIVLKNYMPKNLGYLVFYVGNEFGIFTLVEAMQLYASVEESVRIVLDSVLGRV